MQPLRRLPRYLLGLACCACISGCASTTIAFSPTPQAPVCSANATALVLWAPRWRADQKDVTDREVAASTGLQTFVAGSRCFAHSEVRRVADVEAPPAAQIASANGRFDKVVVIVVRELGPVVKLLSSAALVDGGTEVVLQVAEYSPPLSPQPREFTVHWQHGGPGVVKGVGSLSQDMQAALIAGLQTGAAQP